MNNTSLALGLEFRVDDALIAFYRLDNGQKLLLPRELQEQAQLDRERAMTAEELARLDRKRAVTAEESTRSAQQNAVELAAKLAAYEARFGKMEDQ